MPLPFKPADEAVLYGFEVLRPVADPAALGEAYDYLHDRFGETITPFDQEQDLRLAWAEETGTALIRAGARVLGIQAVINVMKEVEAHLPDDLRNPLVTHTPYFSVTKNASSAGRQLVTLRVGNDDRHARQRQMVTRLIDQQTRTPYAWPNYRALIPIAYLGERSLAQTIRGIRRQQPSVIPFDPVFLRRPAALQ